MKINGKQTQNVIINITPKDIIDSLKESFGFTELYYNHIELKENGLYDVTDISYHGSPIYEYKLITNDLNKIRLYKAIIELENALKEVDKN